MFQFKNLQLYRLPIPWDITLDTLRQKLAANAFRPCPSNEMQSRGWRPPRGGDELAYSCNRQWLLALESEQRLLPAAVVRQTADDRAAEIERQQGFPPGRKQMREIKDQVTQELLPRAFTRRNTTWVWIDPVNGWLGVDASSAGKAEDVLELLRRSLGDLPLTLVNTQVSPAAAMTGWLASGEGPAGFTVDRDCELKAPGEGHPMVRYVRHSLDGDDVTGHVASGKVPTRLGMTWNDRISFVLTERLEVKRLALLDLVHEGTEEGSTADEQFDCDWTLLTGELQQFLPDLMQALGGEVQVSTGNLSTEESSAHEDPEYEKAVKLVVSEQRAGIAFVQRMLRIGYNRAARLIERMEDEGIVSPMKFDGSRTVFRGASAP